VLARFNSEARFLVYLMVRKNHARIRITQTFYSQGFGPACRARSEQADACWVLSHHPTRREALAREYVIAARYGLPTCVWQHAAVSGGLTQVELDAVRAAVGSNIDRAHECLVDHGRNVRGPLWSTDGHNYVAARKTFFAEACNLLPDVMSVLETNVETVTNTLSVKNPRLAAFNTFAVAFEDSWGAIAEEEVERALSWFVGFWDKLVEVRPELTKMSLPARQERRRLSIGVSAIAIHGYVQLARRFYNENLSLDLLDRLRDDDFFSLTNRVWQEQGILVPSVNKAGMSVLQMRNANQTRRAMAAVLVGKVGLNPTDEAAA
jgi:hypothetical protein